MAVFSAEDSCSFRRNTLQEIAGRFLDVVFTERFPGFQGLDGSGQE